jgi:hypothetical protein
MLSPEDGIKIESLGHVVTQLLRSLAPTSALDGEPHARKHKLASGAAAACGGLRLEVPLRDRSAGGRVAFSFMP